MIDELSKNKKLIKKNQKLLDQLTDIKPEIKTQVL